MKKCSNVLIASMLFCLSFSAKSQNLTIEDFSMRGDTYLTEEDCFRLTEELDYASGSIWYKHPISLDYPFVIKLNIMAGCQDESGADGMVFVLAKQPDRLGFRGEGIGYSGLAPSIGIEIDTWLNEHLGDPVEDHISIMANGRLGHWNDVAGPVKIPNIEDCKRHGFHVVWNNLQQKLSVELDGVEIIATQLDIKSKIFGGRDLVYWGVTAGTGRYHNMHEVCFDRLALAPTTPRNRSPHRQERKLMEAPYPSFANQ